MKKIALITALSAALLAGTAFAYPPAGGNGAPCAGAQMDRQAWVKSANETMRGMLNLKPEQQKAFNAYATAALDLQKVRDDLRQKHFENPATNYQDRLAQRIETQKATVKYLEAFAAARADLLKVLSPEQKLVLESFDAHHGAAMPMMGRGMGPGCGGYGFGMGPQGMRGFHQGMGPGMMGPGYHHGYGAPAPQAPEQKKDKDAKF